MLTVTHPVRGCFWFCRIIASLVIAVAAFPNPGIAQNSTRPAIRQQTPLTIDVDKAELIHLREPSQTVFVANPEIANIQVPTPTTFLIYGRKPGATTVFAISETGETTSYNVRVIRPTDEIAAAVRAAVPGARISISATPDGIGMSGSVDSPRNAERVKAAAKQFLGDKENLNFNVTISGGTQVTLRVRVAEVSRNISKSLGLNWSALGNIGTIGTSAAFPALNLIANGSTAVGISPITNPLNLGGNFNAVVDALNQEGLAKILAEPYLTAASGETANFLAGGEYPIPVPQGIQIVTIEYKRFGISVDFTPTVLDENRISIKVRPEVSQLTSVGQLTLNGVSVPALTVRRAETTVELGSGDSFVIAGLYQNNSSNQIQGLPGLEEIPILGALFRSTSFIRNESELVIIVTPYIVNPVTQPNRLHLPTEGLRFSSDLERILMGRLTDPGRQAAVAPIRAPTEPRLRGNAGFMLE